MTTPNPDFLPGLDLCEAYYWESVRPIVLRHFPSLPHAAALIGYGSDVIGCDTPLSRDHMWGPRMQIFLSCVDFDSNRQRLDQALRNELPTTFRGYSTHFGPPDQEGISLLTSIESGPVNHLIEVTTLEEFWERELGVDPFLDPTPLDWLTFQEHRLLTLTAGRVFHDDLNLHAVREQFAYYPTDVWLYLLASQWMLISQEEPFMGRTGENGDELGSRVIAARLVERLMRLCFLMEKRYAPYSKWLGAHFQRLTVAHPLTPLLQAALSGADWQSREQAFSAAYRIVAQMHNALCITPALPVDASPFHSRPYQVIHAGDFAQATTTAITDETIRKLTPYMGSVNQFMVESSNALQNIAFCRRAQGLYKDK